MNAWPFAEPFKGTGGQATPLRLDVAQESSILSVFKHGFVDALGQFVFQGILCVVWYRWQGRRFENYACSRRVRWLSSLQNGTQSELSGTALQGGARASGYQDCLLTLHEDHGQI
jgi:hypothetical protein